MAILRNEFPVTDLTPALDLRHEISRLHTVINRAKPERGRQIENVVAAVSQSDGSSAPKDAVVPSNLAAYATFPELRDFRRAHDIAVNFAAAHGGGELQDAIRAQVDYLLNEQGWVYFSPADLFAVGEQGAWYDPSDLTTLYQDSAGTTTVTADGDPVGLMLDKSGNGNHASQSVATARPIYRTAAGLHWLEFDGVDDNLDTGFKLTTEHTVAVAFVCDMDGRSIITEGASRSAASAHDFDLFSTGTESRYRVTNTLDATTLQVIGPNFDAGASYVAVGAWDGSTNSDAAIFRVNQSQSSDTPTSSTKASRNNVSLGSSGVYPLDGKIYGTVLLGNKRASDNEIVSLEAYLAKLAGVTL